MKKRDRPIEITDEMISVGAEYGANRELPLNEAGFAIALEKALKAGGYAVKIPAWIERES